MSNKTAFTPPLTGAFLPSLRRTHTPHRHRNSPNRRPRAPQANLPTIPHLSSLPRPPRPDRSPDYYANVGSVIDTLRADVPRMLKQSPDMSIYTDDLTFCDGSGYRISGKDAYKTVLWLLRAQGRLVFASHFVEIQSMFHDDAEGCIYLRWRLTANPRWSGMNTFIIDGMSVYRLDGSGWVYEHSLENASRRRDTRVVFDSLRSAGREGRVVGAGAGAGGLPGWYRSLYEPAEYAPLEDGEHCVKDEVE